MSTAKRIDKGLLTQELRTELDNKLNITDTIEWSQITGKPILAEGQYVIVDWIDVANKPSTFNPSNHVHLESEISDLDKYKKSEVDTLLLGKADVNHTHNYAEPTHTHTESQIIDLDKYTKAQVDTLLSGKVNLVEGKQLSSNDFTLYYKQMLDNLGVNGVTNINEHLNNTVNHVSSDDRILWNTVTDKVELDYVTDALADKAEKSTLDGHMANTSVHISEYDRNRWNANAGTYQHKQIAALAEWRIVHNLGKRPSVTVVDTGDNVVIGETQYVSDDEIVLKFSAEFSGTAYLN